MDSLKGNPTPSAMSPNRPQTLMNTGTRVFARHQKGRFFGRGPRSGCSDSKRAMGAGEADDESIETAKSVNVSLTGVLMQ